MEAPEDGPVMVPPVTVQAYVFPGTGIATLKVVVVDVQVVKAPLITGTGCGAIKIEVVTVESHAAVFDSVTEMLPFPLAGQFTVIVLLLVEITVPPVTDQV